MATKVLNSGHTAPGHGKSAVRSIRGKILTGIFAVVTILTVVLMSVMTYFMNSLTSTILRETLQPMAKTAAQSVEANLHLMADRIFLTRDNAVLSDRNAPLPEKQKVLDKAISGIEFVWIGIYNLGGRLLTGSEDCPVLMGDSAFFDEMKATENLVIADTSFDSSGLEIVVGTPIFDAEDEMYSYLVGSYDYGILYDSMSNINLGSKGSAFIVNNEGVYMAHKDVSLIENRGNIRETFGESDEIAEMLEQMRLGQTGIV
ncbi:MAG: cache domain-containing protein, partial [Clostridiales Family XIII bacterium]|nr:cache domain-containing protein [Clostridiales Family XIII bacterium]